ncbi:sprT domain-containing protein [Cupriavidus basilensis]|uniref:sprT domain-containing protein n=1 Tax=Cupriavidus basilensis TaxID=68895 RepID=UPI0023E8300A|nr:sprT domain-containing protein [Cupriavidus basilensis]MDF3889010.1 sprT domain-containing protein [Cupriavidus basilensis]
MATPTSEAYTELQSAYDFFNGELFDGSLPACLITLQRDKRSYGYFSASRFVNADGATTDEIAMNPAYFATVPLIEILQTLVKEMVHIWQLHHGKPGRGRYCNKQFAEKMKSLGLVPTSTGEPGGAEVGDKVMSYPGPGGRFLQVCEALLQTEFRISWMDRHPIRPEHIATPEGLESDPAATALVELGAFSIPEVADLAEEVGPKNTSNRTKYTCITCELNVWGKPELRIGCLECGGEFVAAEGEGVKEKPAAAGSEELG